MVCKLSEIVFPPEPSSSVGSVLHMVPEGLELLSPPIIVSPFCGDLRKPFIMHSYDMAGPMPFATQVCLDPQPDASAACFSQRFASGALQFPGLLNT